MKPILFLLLLFSVVSGANSQTNYSTDKDFAELQKRFVIMNRTGFQPNLIQSMSYFQLLSAQARQLASTLKTDREKGEFLYQVFPQIKDPENYFEVLDVFQDNASAFRLYHYTIGSFSALQASQNPPVNYPSQYRGSQYVTIIQTSPDCQMSSEDFQKLISTLDSTMFNDSKISVVRNYSSKNCFSSSQIASIMDKFTYEDAQLDVAKSLYNSCIDKNNYTSLINNLTYSDSKEKLNEFIASH